MSAPAGSLGSPCSSSYSGSAGGSPKNSLYRILLVDEMELVRIGLAQIIGAASQLIVCAATDDYDQVDDLIERHRPHLVVAEPFQPNRDGIIWIKELRANFPQLKILVASYSRDCGETKNGNGILAARAALEQPNRRNFACRP